MQKSFLVFIAGALLCLSSAFAAERPHYEIDATFDKATSRLTATEKVTYVNDTGKEQSEVHFNIYANKKYLLDERNRLLFFQNYFKVNAFPYGLHDTDFALGSVASQGKTLPYTIEGAYSTAMVVALPVPLAPGASVTFDISFTMKLPHQYGLLAYYRDVYCFAHWYPVLSVYKDGFWHDNPLATDHQPYFYDMADFDVRFTMPSDFVTAQSGNEVTSKDNGDGSKTVTYRAENVRDFTMAASPQYRVMSRIVNGVEVRLVYLPYDADVAPKGLEYACDAMAYYQKTLGAYPYKTFTVAETHIGWLGNEFSTIVFIDTRGFNIPKILYHHLDFLISHEMTHQWFYLQVGSDQYRETWMDEGLTVFVNYRYLQEKYGKTDNYLDLPDWAKILPNSTFDEARNQSYLSSVRAKQDQPVLLPIDKFENPQRVFATTYNKGSHVLDMLEARVGKAKFWEIMRAYIVAYSGKTASAEDFIAFFKERSGQDLDAFFKDWLTTTKSSDWGIEKVRRNEVTVKQYGTIAEPVRLRCEYKDGTIEERDLEGKLGEQRIELSAGKPIKRVTIDPDRVSLDTDLKNNAWPMKRRMKWTPVYIQIYDFPIVNPSDSYSATGGFKVNIFDGGLKLGGQRAGEYASTFETVYDYGHKDAIVRGSHETQEIFDGINLHADAEHISSIDSAEHFEMGRIGLKKSMGPEVGGVDPIENYGMLYTERNLERDLFNDQHQRMKIGLERNIDYRILAWDPVGGAKFNQKIEQSGQYLGSNADFIKSESDFRLYSPTGVDSHTIVNRVDLGLSHGDVNGKERFVLGGRKGLRGFSEKDTQAQNKFIYSAEYRFNLIDEREDSFLRNFLTFNRMNAAVFYDAGTAWDRQCGKGDIKQDIGFGVDFEVTVLGFFEKTLNRFDVAVPTDGRGKNDGVRLTFDITHAF